MVESAPVAHIPALLVMEQELALLASVVSTSSRDSVKPLAQLVPSQSTESAPALRVLSSTEPAWLAARADSLPSTEPVWPATPTALNAQEPSTLAPSALLVSPSMPPPQGVSLLTTALTAKNLPTETARTSATMASSTTTVSASTEDASVASLTTDSEAVLEAHQELLVSKASPAQLDNSCSMETV